jgi:hypothetical protein
MQIGQWLYTALMKKLYLLLILTLLALATFAQNGGNRDKSKEAKINSETIIDIKIIEVST